MSHIYLEIGPQAWKGSYKHCKYILYMNTAIIYSRLKYLKFELFFSNKNEETFHISSGISTKAIIINLGKLVLF